MISVKSLVTFQNYLFTNVTLYNLFYQVNVGDIGTIYKIRIGLDSTSKKATWRLEQVNMDIGHVMLTSIQRNFYRIRFGSQMVACHI